MLLVLDLPLLAAARTTMPRPGSHSRKSKRLRTHLRTRNKHWRLRRIFIPWSPVKGSRESLLRQNERTDELERIQDDEQLTELTESGALVDLPQDATVLVAPNLPEERRYCRPWTRTFIADFARDYFTQFGEPLQVTSAVLAGIVWMLENPARGIVEADEMDFRRCLELQRPYLGPVVGRYTDWTPLVGRGELFPETLDTSDPWQFTNVLVS